MAERVATYLDFENGNLVEMAEDDTIPTKNLANVIPANYVVMNTTNTDPFDDYGFGSWTYLGSQTIGATTVYYYQNTAV